MAVKRAEYQTKLIGRIGDSYYYLQELFEHKGQSKGAIGSIMMPVSINEASNRRDTWDECNELWKAAVVANRTDLGADAWHEMVMSQGGDDIVFDLSYPDLADDLLRFLNDPTVELCECVGGGRCFDLSLEWDDLYEPELWNLIKKFESE